MGGRLISRPDFNQVGAEPRAVATGSKTQLEWQHPVATAPGSVMAREIGFTTSARRRAVLSERDILPQHLPLMFIDF